MSTSALTKLSYINTHRFSSDVWDDGGRTKIARIYISYGADGIDGVQFAYFENGKVVLGDKHGRFGYSYAVVDFRHPSEVFTALRGHCDQVDRLCSLSIVTNKATYGPFGCDITPKFNRRYIPVNFELGDGRPFAGFHGTIKGSRLQSIGVYIKSI